MSCSHRFAEYLSRKEFDNNNTFLKLRNCDISWIYILGQNPTNFVNFDIFSNFTKFLHNDNGIEGVWNSKAFSNPKNSGDMGHINWKKVLFLRGLGLFFNI